MKPKLPQLNLRDLFWLVLVCALVLGYWLQIARVRKLEMELKYLKSAVPPIAFIETPIDDAIYCLSLKHSIRIEVDWESLKSKGITPRTLITQNLVDGSLSWALKRLFLGVDDVQIIPTTEGLRISANRPEANE